MALAASEAEARQLAQATLLDNPLHSVDTFKKSISEYLVLAAVERRNEIRACLSGKNKLFHMTLSSWLYDHLPRHQNEASVFGLGHPSGMVVDSHVLPRLAEVQKESGHPTLHTSSCRHILTKGQAAFCCR